MQPRLRSARPILQLGRSQATFRLFHLASLLHIGPRSERNRASERVGHCQCPVAVAWMVTNVCFVVALAMLGGGTPLFAQDEQVRLALDDLVAAYPYALAGHDAKVLRWRDGTVMPVYDGADSSGVWCERVCSRRAMEDRENPSRLMPAPYAQDRTWWKSAANPHCWSTQKRGAAVVVS